MPITEGLTQTCGESEEKQEIPASSQNAGTESSDADPSSNRAGTRDTVVKRQSNSGRSVRGAYSDPCQALYRLVSCRNNSSLHKLSQMNKDDFGYTLYTKV